MAIAMLNFPAVVGPRAGSGRASPGDQGAALGHLVMATGLLFIALQNPIFPSPLRFMEPTTAQSMFYVPRTPPPVFDPEWTPSEEWEAEVHFDYWR